MTAAYSATHFVALSVHAQSRLDEASAKALFFIGTT
jgi:hypothetical protein